jgi:hypothetical protein
MLSKPVPVPARTSSISSSSSMSAAAALSSSPPVRAGLPAMSAASAHSRVLPTPGR